jgi:hypothetical protein
MSTSGPSVAEVPTGSSLSEVVARVLDLQKSQGLGKVLVCLVGDGRVSGPG